MNYEQVYESLMGSMNKMWEMMIMFAPKVITALALLILGYFISKIVSRAIRIALEKVGVNKLGEKVGLAELLVSWRMSPNLAQLMGKFCYIFMFLIFMLSAADVLELDSVTNTIDKFILYIPNIIGAFVVFFLTSIAAHFVKQATLRTGESLRLDFAGVLANVFYYAILVIGVILAIGQLKIETAFLTEVLQILLVSAGVAMALSLGIGSRDVSKNIVAGVYLKDSLQEGATVKVGEYEGVLTSIKPVCFELKEASGRSVILPNSRLLECEIIFK